jgi:hypothetical protein
VGPTCRRWLAQLLCVSWMRRLGGSGRRAGRVAQEFTGCSGDWAALPTRSGWGARSAAWAKAQRAVEPRRQVVGGAGWAEEHAGLGRGAMGRGTRKGWGALGRDAGQAELAAGPGKESRLAQSHARARERLRGVGPRASQNGPGTRRGAGWELGRGAGWAARWLGWGRLFPFLFLFFFFLFEYGSSF